MDNSGNTGTPGLDGRHWTRGEVIRQPLFWALMPGIISPAFIMTAMFFLPAHIAESKGWAFGIMPSWYWVFALSAVGSAFLAGAMIDRFSARACLPLYQLPMASGMIVLWAAPAPEMAPVALALMGLTAGASSTINSALWAEYFGTHHIGTIKALSHALMVFSSAIGPGFAGAVIDLGAPFPQQALWYAAYAAAVCGFFLWIATRKPTRAVSETC
jgi:MFS family permease